MDSEQEQQDQATEEGSEQPAQPTESAPLEPQVTSPTVYEPGQEQPKNLPTGPVLADDQEDQAKDEGRGEE